MDNNAAQFTGSIPQHYDSGLGPVLFAHYAEVVAELVADRAPKRILETAAGTGISSAAIARLNRDAELTVTDLNGGMLEFAREKLPEGVQLETVDAQDLPYEDGAFDAVACQFGIMFLPDLAAGFSEARRVLSEGGRFIFSVWDSHAKNRWAALTDAAITAHFPDNPPTFYRVPFSRSEVDPLRELAQASGFGKVSVHVVPFTAPVASWTDLARGLILGNPVSDQIRERGGDLASIEGEVAATLEAENSPGQSMPIQALFHVAEAC